MIRRKKGDSVRVRRVNEDNAQLLKKQKPTGVQALLSIIGKRILSFLTATFSVNLHVGKAAVVVVLVVFVMLGWKFGVRYDKHHGWQCSMGYVPPDPDDVKKILKADQKADNNASVKKRLIDKVKKSVKKSIEEDEDDE